LEGSCGRGWAMTLELNLGGTNCEGGRVALSRICLTIATPSGPVVRPQERHQGLGRHRADRNAGSWASSSCLKTSLRAARGRLAPARVAPAGAVAVLCTHDHFTAVWYLLRFCCSRRPCPGKPAPPSPWCTSAPTRAKGRARAPTCRTSTAPRVRPKTLSSRRRLRALGGSWRTPAGGFSKR